MVYLEYTIPPPSAQSLSLSEKAPANDAHRHPLVLAYIHILSLHQCVCVCVCVYDEGEEAPCCTHRPNDVLSHFSARHAAVAAAAATRLFLLGENLRGV